LFRTAIGWFTPMTISGVASFAGFAAMWAFVSALLSWLSGWRDMSRHYRCSSQPEGSVWYMQCGSIGGVTYKNCLTIASTANGLYLALFPLFAVASPPLLIPWSHVVGINLSKGWIADSTVIRIGQPTTATIELPGSWYTSLFADWQANQNWPDPCMKCNRANLLVDRCRECGSSWHETCVTGSCPVCGAASPRAA
jgi:hypothetical protein